MGDYRSGVSIRHAGLHFRLLEAGFALESLLAEAANVHHIALERRGALPFPGGRGGGRSGCIPRQRAFGAPAGVRVLYGERLAARAGRTLLVESQAELSRRVDKGCESGEGDEDPVGAPAESKRHREATIVDREIAELELEHHGHLCRVLLPEARRKPRLRVVGPEGDEEVMVTGKA